MFHLDTDLVRLVNTLNTELETLGMWFKINKLSLNVGKSNYMIFGNKKVVLMPVKLEGKELIRCYGDQIFRGSNRF